MAESKLTDRDFDAEFFATHDDPAADFFRLEDLSSEEANNPTGRGSETAAPRGYDNERVACKIFNGVRTSAPWFDVQYETKFHNLLECKLCISEYPNGQTGTFKLWKKHHRKLLGCQNEYPSTVGHYFFLIYTLVDGSVREIGKFTASPIVIEGMIDNWCREHHDTMGTEYSKELKWTRLMSIHGLEPEDLRQRELVGAAYNVDLYHRFQRQVTHEIRLNNPFQSEQEPYPVCQPSCEPESKLEKTRETA